MKLQNSTKFEKIDPEALKMTKIAYFQHVSPNFTKLFEKFGDSPLHNKWTVAGLIARGRRCSNFDTSLKFKLVSAGDDIGDSDTRLNAVAVAVPHEFERSIIFAASF
ncbi:hypothetical protein L596_009970 [Steinernema carpocapsae]|uniref:Uncharacterized protein n=1 Tax=Steinernema carpocapsae TaxID=34508 RepID=A0A4U5PGW6_STECR|nr:hypothetical protein L596_009970 [Steinernema carpocapsae]